MANSESPNTQKQQLIALMEAVNRYSYHNPLLIKDINAQFTNLEAALGEDHPSLMKLSWEWEARQQKYRDEQALAVKASEQLWQKRYPKEFAVNTPDPAQPQMPSTQQAAQPAVTFTQKRDRDWPPEHKDEKSSPNRENEAGNKPSAKKPKI